jgi:serine/threonine protein kinase
MFGTALVGGLLHVSPEKVRFLALHRRFVFFSALFFFLLSVFVFVLYLHSFASLFLLSICVCVLLPFRRLTCQILGQSYSGQKNDIWSLGIVLYQTLFNKSPFNPGPGGDTKQMFKGIISGQFDYPAEPQVSPGRSPFRFCFRFWFWFWFLFVCLFVLVSM